MVIYFSDHALNRMKERSITTEEVMETVKKPMDIITVKYGRKAYTRHFRRCRYIIAIAEQVDEDLIVVTTLKVGVRGVLKYGFTKVRSKS